MSERDLSLATSLAIGGKKLDVEIRAVTRDLLKKFKGVDLFLIAISQSLIWTGHAVDKGDYFSKALDFLNTGGEKPLSDLSRCYGRYGLESLKTILYNWRKLHEELTIPPKLLESCIEELIIFQTSAYNIACTARKQRSVMNIGAWLFCAPFKIILCLRDELWSDARVDEILMPLGLEVIRGTRKIIRRRYSYSTLIDAGMLEEEEGDLVEGLATIHIVQAMCKTIANDAGSNVLHINSGLWRLGRGEL